MPKSLLALFLSLSWCAGASSYAADLQALEMQELKAAHITRVSYSRDVPPADRGSKSFTYVSNLVEPRGVNYVILTDMDDAYAGSIEKLRRAHDGKVVRIESFRNLVSDPNARAQLLVELRKSSPKYLAIAPRIENYSENVVLAMMTTLVELGGGSVRVFPAFMTGFDPETFDAFVDRSLALKPLKLNELSPFVVAQSTNASAGGVRALEKARFYDKLFTDLGNKPAGLVVRTPTASDDDGAVKLPFPVFDAGAQGKLMSLPEESAPLLAKSHMLVLFGHGVPGMTCSIDVSALRDIPMKDDIILCGSCFSAIPVYSDIPSFAEKRGKHSAPFFRRAITNGAAVFYGHMHENGGFPALFVASDALMSGETVGQSYQRVINANLGEVRIPIDKWILSSDQLQNPAAFNPRNDLLYVMFGDPAARPVSN